MKGLDVVLATTDAPETLKEIGGCTFQPAKRRIRAADGKEISLPYSEALILAALWRTPGHFLTQSAIYDALYWDRGEAGEPTKDGIRIFICRLRRRLPVTLRIETIYNHGYELRWTDASPRPEGGL